MNGGNGVFWDLECTTGANVVCIPALVSSFMCFSITVSGYLYNLITKVRVIRFWMDDVVPQLAISEGPNKFRDYPLHYYILRCSPRGSE